MQQIFFVLMKFLTKKVYKLKKCATLQSSRLVL